MNAIPSVRELDRAQRRKRVAWEHKDPRFGWEIRFRKNIESIRGRRWGNVRK